MDMLELIGRLQKQSKDKIILLVMDGLGGLAMEPSGPTALEAANTPNLDLLARRGSIGQTIPIRPGITPGSGPAHLAMFGYDPLRYEVGRGVLEATGVGIRVAPGDVAARGNFCTLDEQGLISDRRAGRIPSDQAAPLVKRMQSIKVRGYKIELRHLREYRFVIVMRGAGLEPFLADTDPQQVGRAPLEVVPKNSSSKGAAAAFNEWIDKALGVLSDQPVANGLTLRGFSTNPELPQLPAHTGLKPICVAVYPMYKGAAKLVGMEILEFEGETPKDEFAALHSAWKDYDFAFIHIKATDSRGEDGDLEGKAAAIEEVDRQVGMLLDLEPSVIAVTGDHSTPARLRSHSWHPVPFLLWAPGRIRTDDSTTFGETACAKGGLGTFEATMIMPQLLAHADRLNKYGA